MENVKPLDVRTNYLCRPSYDKWRYSIIENSFNTTPKQRIDGVCWAHEVQIEKSTRQLRNSFNEKNEVVLVYFVVLTTFQITVEISQAIISNVWMESFGDIGEYTVSFSVTYDTNTKDYVEVLPIAEKDQLYKLNYINGKYYYQNSSYNMVLS